MNENSRVSPVHLVLETPELYQDVTLPHIMNEQRSIQWMYNLLDHNEEVEKIIYEDPDPETGFILVPNRWSIELKPKYLRCLAIIRQRGLKSLRDLRASHLPLLRNLREKAVTILCGKFRLQPSQLRCYFHYQPSYYHLHLHITSMAFSPGCDRSHLLDTVIDNIERYSHYYEEASLSFKVRETDQLYRKYQDCGYFPPPALTESEFEAGSCSKTIKFLEVLGRAKHLPCQEFLDSTMMALMVEGGATPTYGETAWRMAMMGLCLGPGLDLSRVVGLALVSSLASLSHQNTQWTDKVTEVTEVLQDLLPPTTAAQLAGMFSEHAMVVQGKLDGSKEHEAYKSVLEMEKMLVSWGPLEVKEGKPVGELAGLLEKMSALKFPAAFWENFDDQSDPAPLGRLLVFIVRLSRLQSLKRPCWVRCEVREPETVASHLYRVALMGLMVAGSDAAIIALCHDMAECLTPHHNVSSQDNTATETFRDLVKDLPDNIGDLISGSHKGYDDPKLDDLEDVLEDLVNFDMILQAWEYEKRDRRRYIRQSFDSTDTGLTTVPALKWQRGLLAIREKYLEDFTEVSGRSRSHWRSEELEGQRLHVADLSSRARQWDLEQLFKTFGPIQEISLASSVPYFAFVVFKSAEDAYMACRATDGQNICGRRVRVNMARPRRCGECGERGHSSVECPDTSYQYRRTSYSSTYRSRSRTRDRGSLQPDQDRQQRSHRHLGSSRPRGERGERGEEQDTRHQGQ